MASLMEELLGVLEKEETEYLTLIDLADVKSQAIIKADIAKLGEVTEKEPEAASTLLNLSNKRTQVLNDMATVLGKKPEQMTINRMIGYLENQPESSRCLRSAGQTFRSGNEDADIEPSERGPFKAGDGDGGI